MNGRDTLDLITAEIVAAIEAGAGEWHMPWQGASANFLPTNAVTHAPYRGGNVLWLWFIGSRSGYPTAEWATYNQWKSIGVQVQKGEKATPCVYWKAKVDKDDPERTTMIPCGFSVFNAAQTDYHGELVESPASLDLAGFFQAIPFNLGHGMPSYSVHTDLVRMPQLATFDSFDDYCATLAHELGHWTGHPSRLDRTYGKRFGDYHYAAEELVAEMSAAFTCGLVGIAGVARRDHASYLSYWLRMLKAEPSTLWTVASKAQAATDHLASYTTTEEISDDSTPALAHA